MGQIVIIPVKIKLIFILSKLEITKPNFNFVFPYHWNNRAKLYDAYKYVGKVYEHYLLLLSERLNHIHCLNHSVRYWRIVVGPWLQHFITVLFDKYCSINEVSKFPVAHFLDESENEKNSKKVQKEMEKTIKLLLETDLRSKITRKLIEGVFHQNADYR